MNACGRNSDLNPMKLLKKFGKLYKGSIDVK